jgi:hypothetical protein
MSATADDTPTAALAEIRERGYRRDVRVAEAARLSDSAAVDVPRLLAALDAVLKLHERVPIYGYADGYAGGTCPHGPDYDGDAHFESDDAEWLCTSLPEGATCDVCRGIDGDNTDWPCPTYEAIALALAGKEKPDA